MPEIDRRSFLVGLASAFGVATLPSVAQALAAPEPSGVLLRDLPVENDKEYVFSAFIRKPDGPWRRIALAFTPKPGQTEVPIMLDELVDAYDQYGTRSNYIHVHPDWGTKMVHVSEHSEAIPGEPQPFGAVTGVHDGVGLALVQLEEAPLGGPMIDTGGTLPVSSGFQFTLGFDGHRLVRESFVGPGAHNLIAVGEPPPELRFQSKNGDGVLMHSASTPALLLRRG